MKTTVYTLTQEPAVIVPAIKFASRTVYVDPLANDVYLGGLNVSTTTGVKLRKNDITSFVIPPNESLYAMVATGSHPVIVLEPST
jgi:hypothetical protein